MKISTNPENLRERIGLALGIIPRPLGDVFLGPLLAKTILAASSLGIFDLLAKEPKTPEQIADECGNHKAATGQLLRALYASGYLRWSNGRYGLTRMSERWLLRGSAKSLHFAILHRAIDFRFMDFERFVRTGEASDFHRDLDEDEWARYHRGQASQANLILQDVVKRIPVPAGVSTMLDLGGGHGLYSLALCERYPDLHSRVLDLATPLQHEVSMAHSNAGSRVRFEKADILIAPLDVESVDLVLLASVIHHFDAPTNCQLFCRIADALRPGGFLVVLDLMRADSVIESHQIEALMDLYFGAASGTRLWTPTEIQSWQDSAGLQPLPPAALRMLPDCKIQSAQKLTSGRYPLGSGKGWAHALSRIKNIWLASDGHGKRPRRPNGMPWAPVIGQSSRRASLISCH